MGKGSRKITERISAFHRDNSVAEQANALHPLGQAIRASTNCGFNVRIVGKVGDPGCEIVKARREETSRAWPASRSSFWRSPPLLACPPVALATEGVCQW